MIVTGLSRRDSGLQFGWNLRRLRVWPPHRHHHQQQQHDHHLPQPHSRTAIGIICPDVFVIRGITVLQLLLVMTMAAAVPMMLVMIMIKMYTVQRSDKVLRLMGRGRSEGCPRDDTEFDCLVDAYEDDAERLLMMAVAMAMIGLRLRALH